MSNSQAQRQSVVGDWAEAQYIARVEQRERERGKPRILFAGLKSRASTKPAEFLRTRSGGAEDAMGIMVGDKKGPVAEPNVVPLIDVLLVLIIIFLVITPQILTGLPTVAPQLAPSQVRAEPPQTVVVQVMQGGTLMINRDESDWNMLERG